MGLDDMLKQSLLLMTALWVLAPSIPIFAQNMDAEANPPDHEPIIRVKRPLLMVKDLDRSLAFYRNIVGLKLHARDENHSIDQDNLGRKIFNTPKGTRWRIATLDTSDETRGLALREIDAEFEVPSSPYVSTVLFEASDALAIYERARAKGLKVIAPNFQAAQQAGGDAQYLGFVELAIVDPDGHVLAFYNYYENSELGRKAWNRDKTTYP